MRIFLLMVQSVLFLVERGIVGVVLGVWDGLLPALVLFMVVEYLTQILITVMNKNMSNEIGFSGISKKVSIFCLVAVGNTIDVLIIKNGSTIRTAVVLFYLSNEGITILENVEKLGLPIPQKLKDILEIIKDGDK